MRYMNFNDLRNQQNQVIAETDEKAPGFNEHVGTGITGLLAALYETAHVPDISNQHGVVQSHAWLWIYQAVYTMVASLTCFESGFYSESLALNRCLCESLVHILYLKRHPSAVQKLPNMNNGRKRQIQLRTMFDEIAPGYYGTSYKFSSEFTHPGLAGNIYKLQRDQFGKGQVDQGVIFKLKPLTHCFNELSMLILGFLRCIPLVYPSLAMKEEALEAWTAGTSSMQAAIDSHIKLKGGPNDWHLLSEPLWNPK
jgi:hypothetical protein